MKDTKHVRRDFHSVPWVMPQGSNIKYQISNIKGQISLNFGNHVNFKDFYTKFCVCSHNGKIQNISDKIFILLPGSCLRGGTLGH